MRSFSSVVCKGLLAAAILGFAAAAWTAEKENNEPVRHLPAAAAEPTDRLLVLWNTNAAANKRAQVDALAKQAGTTVISSRRINSRLELLSLGSTSPTAAAVMLANLRADPRVQFADYDHRRFAHAVPNDPDYPYVSGVAGQWYLQAVEASAIRAEAAWDVSKGHNGIVIADLDTGIRYDHPDLRRAVALGKLLPGYDFVTIVLQANDGNGRDADPSDPGDWISPTDQAQHPQEFGGCDQSASSWHGTRTAGIIGALTNNSLGVAGISWNTYILPVRVLGKCGGFDGDILDAMRWAAGLHVDGVPENAYPARVINMSLGGSTNCNAAYQNIFAELTAAGVVVVASAGNEGEAVGSPANCQGAIAVAGLRSIGTKVGFSNLGANVTISAPGGNCVNTNGGPCLFSIDTTTGTGATVPTGFGYTDQNNFNVGTSFSAPMVSGVASLMMSVNANLKPSHIITRLKSGASKPFPTNPDPTIPTCHVPANDIQDSECNCTTTTCGAGMLNAQGAMAQAVRPIASVALPASVSAGNNVTLGGSRSVASCGRSIATYRWDVTSGTAVVSNPNIADTTVPAPATGSIIVRLTVTDDQGATDTADITITPSAATSSVPTIIPVNACPASLTVPQIPLPSVSLTVDPLSVTAGQSALLNWFTSDATSCVASGAWSGAKGTAGAQSTGALAVTSTFGLSCDGPAGTSPVASVTVTVLALPTVTLSANPASVSAGQSSTLTWSSTDATSCTASGAWTGAKATSGSASTGALALSSTFTLVCDGPAGTSIPRSVIVTVAPPSATLSASPTSITSGQSSTLTWSSTNATSCTASGAWSGAKATSGSESTGALTATTTFSLACDGPTGTSPLRSATVTVTAGGGGGGGGGGAIEFLTLLSLSLLLVSTRRSASA